MPRSTRPHLAFSLMVAIGSTACASTSAPPADAPLAPSVVGGGHLLLYVPDVAKAMADARAAGFDPAPGTAGDAPDNAMVHLKNGWFIEFVNPGNFPPYVRVFTWFVPALDNRIRAWSAAGPGDVFDWSVDVSDIESSRTAALREGIAMSGVRGFSRTQPTGIPTTWKLAIPEDPGLPFFKSPYVDHIDVTDRMAHANGARQLASFTVVVPDVDKARARLAQTLQLQPHTDTSFCVQDVQVNLEQGDGRGVKNVVLVSETQTGTVPLATTSVTFIADGARPCAR